MLDDHVVQLLWQDNIDPPRLELVMRHRIAIAAEETELVQDHLWWLHLWLPLENPLTDAREPCWSPWSFSFGVSEVIFFIIQEITSLFVFFFCWTITEFCRQDGENYDQDWRKRSRDFVKGTIYAKYVSCWSNLTMGCFGCFVIVAWLRIHSHMT